MKKLFHVQIYIESLTDMPKVDDDQTREQSYYEKLKKFEELKGTSLFEEFERETFVYEGVIREHSNAQYFFNNVPNNRILSNNSRKKQTKGIKEKYLTF